MSNTLTLVVSYVIAIAIPLSAVWLVWALDIFKTTRIRTIVIAFLWGATGAIGLAYVVNNALIRNVGLGFTQLSNFVAPIVEEIFKALVLIYLIRHPSFRYFVDGAVYGFAAGIGFAMSENLFLYLPGAGSAVLIGSISRVLSASLMHAGASALVGIALGRLRRAERGRVGWPAAGILFAIVLHVVYNNVVNTPGLQGVMLLVIAIGMGLGAAMATSFLINQGLGEEKQRFREALGVTAGVSTGERKAVQRLGGSGAEAILDSLREQFGDETAMLIRKMLAKQGNIGILKGNLSVPVSPRLRQAWEREIAQLEQEVGAIRSRLGPIVKQFIQEMFPPEDDALWDRLDAELGEHDKTLVHTFDLFMRVTELAQSFTPEQLENLAERLSKIEIFKHVSLANLENLSRAITMARFADGAVIFNKGDAGDAMYMIESGYIDIYAQDYTGAEKLLRTFRPGDVVGEFSLLDGQPRSASAHARRSLMVLALHRQAFNMFISSRPQVIFAMLQYLSEKVRYTTTAVQTALDSARRIAEGNYEEMPEFAQALPEPEETELLEPEALSEDTPKVVGGMFARLTEILEQRERTPKDRLDYIE
ncbi:MAG: PrsW family intramembrane metalloprotease [Anaerolineae bacterium]|nr:PrsW family intramembrane metalloprotease [Anaerolineae bacterium]